MSQTKAIVNKLLTTVSNGYFPDGYIAEKVLPLIEVGQKTGILGKYGMNHIRLEQDLIAGLGAARRVEPISRDVSNLYSIDSHALEGVVSEDDLDNSEDPFNAKSDEVMGLTHLILTRKEKILADQLFDPAIVTQGETLVGADKWSDYAGSSPLSVAKTAQNTTLDGCGVQYNAAVMSAKVRNTLSYHPEILENLGFKFDRAGTLSDADIMKAFKLDSLLIGSVAYNTTKEGQADTLGQIWGDSVLFYVKPSSAAKYQTAFGYYARMRSRKGRRVFEYNLDNPPNAIGVIVQDDYSYELVNVKAGYLVSSAI